MLGSSFVLEMCVLTLPSPRAQKTKAVNEGGSGGSVLKLLRLQCKSCCQVSETVNQKKTE